MKTIILGVLTLIALAGCTPSAGGSPASPAASNAVASNPAASNAVASAPAGGMAITERDFRFDQPSLSVPSGTALDVTNAGPTVHNLAIRNDTGAVLATTDDLKPGTSQTLPLKLPAGTYRMFCSLPGHESLGLKGTITITP